MRTFVVTLLALYLSVSMGIVSGTGPLCFRFTAKPGPEAGQTNPPDLRHLPRQALTDCARPMRFGGGVASVRGYDWRHRRR